MRISVELPRGVAALLGAEAAERRAVEARAVEHLLAAGFDEVVLPVVDYFDPYAPVLSEAGRGELYRFVDRDGQLLALRADFTPMLARLLAPRLAALELPLRLFYRGDVVRQRAAGERELFQLGAELLGLPPADAERQALSHFAALLATVAPAPVRLVLGLAGALDGLLLDGRSASEAAALAAAVARRERGVAAAAHPALAEIVAEGMPRDPGVLGEVAARRLQRLEAVRGEIARCHPEMEIGIDLAELATQTLAPELAAAAGERPYYDGVVFRGYLGRDPSPVGGGGRYDQLFARLGAAVSAAGFSLALDRLLPSAVEGMRR